VASSGATKGTGQGAAFFYRDGERNGREIIAAVILQKVVIVGKKAPVDATAPCGRVVQQGCVAGPVVGLDASPVKPPVDRDRKDTPSLRSGLAKCDVIRQQVRFRRRRSGSPN
jgi:hypothetical protein